MIRHYFRNSTTETLLGYPRLGTAYGFRSRSPVKCLGPTPAQGCAWKKKMKKLRKHAWHQDTTCNATLFELWAHAAYLADLELSAKKAKLCKLLSEFQIRKGNIQVAVAAHVATHDHSQEHWVIEESCEAPQLVIHGGGIAVLQALNQDQLEYV